MLGGDGVRHKSGHLPTIVDTVSRVRHKSGHLPTIIDTVSRVRQVL